MLLAFRCGLQQLRRRDDVEAAQSERSGRMRLGTTSFAMSTCTISPCWLRVSLRTRIMPRSGRERDGVTSSISLTTRERVAWPRRLGPADLSTAPDDSAAQRQAGFDE